MGGEVDSGDADAEFSSSPVPGAPSSSVVMAHERCHPADVTSGSVGMSDDVGMVVDTSTAARNRTPAIGCATIEAPAEGNEHADCRGDEYPPVREKRKSDMGAVTDRGSVEVL